MHSKFKPELPGTHALLFLVAAPSVLALGARTSLRGTSEEFEHLYWITLFTCTREKYPLGKFLSGFSVWGDREPFPPWAVKASAGSLTHGSQGSPPAGIHAVVGSLPLSDSLI